MDKEQVMKIYCFGSDIVEGDAIAFDVADNLKIPEVEFVKVKDPYHLYDVKEEDFVIMDAVKGIYFVKVIDDLSVLRGNSPVSAHDFDLSMFLQLLKQMGRIKHITIIGLPFGKKLDEVSGDVTDTIKRLLKNKK